MNKSLFEEYTNLYPVNKTLRFELIPQGRTSDYIEKYGILATDIHRADSYQKVKKIIDEYHKAFIDQKLSTVQILGLEEYAELYFKKSKDQKEIEHMAKLQQNMRMQISNALTKNEEYKRLFGEKLITEDLKQFVSTDKLDLIDEFKGFTTYFTGYHENRKNMYSSEEKHTAIAYRLINENLHRFLDNVKVFEQLIKCLNEEQIAEIKTSLLNKMQWEEFVDEFKVEGFNNTLTQAGIDLYNYMIGGFSPDEFSKVKGLNEYINLINQKDKNIKLGKFQPLYKQILSDRQTTSFIPEQFESDDNLLETIENTYRTIEEMIKGSEGKASLEKMISGFNRYDKRGIFVKNNIDLNELSNLVYGDWHKIKENINEWYDDLPENNKKKSKNYEENRKKVLKKNVSYSLHFIESICNKNNDNKDISEVLLNCMMDNIEQINVHYSFCKDLLNTSYPKGKNIVNDGESVEKIKALLDAMKALQRSLYLLKGDGKENEKDTAFYSDFAVFEEALSILTVTYNRVRNYLTRKPYSTKKVKLTFNTSTLMDGWDLNKEEQNKAVIFKRNSDYYLGIMEKSNNKVFREIPAIEDDEIYEKMEYKLLPGPNKMLPKVFFSKLRIGEFNPSERILNIKEKESFKKGDNFNIDDCHELIDFYKDSIEKHPEWKKYNFKFSDTESYADISEFYREVEKQGYNVSFKRIPKKYIDKLVDEGKLFLFKIYNKDFSKNSKGMPNLFTLYWKAIFDEKNSLDTVYKLNGQAEVFYREKSIDNENKVIHPAEEELKNKNPLNMKKTSIFSYSITKDKRYTVDKFQLHIPVTMNFSAYGRENINNQVLKTIHDYDGEMHIIGIDRGERNLIYISVIDMAGNIVEQYSLNEIVNEYGKTDYRELLNRREKDREAARVEWKTIENIKELKAGYLSQVVHKVTQLMLKYNAIVVMEDLNFGFKRGRQKVEKQVYQNFEKALIEKLNYYVDKKINKDDSDANGSVFHAFQLTSKFESYQKLGHQSGFLFYVPAWNTSKIDPATGFTNLLYPKYKNIEDSKAFISRIDNIRYFQDERLNEEYFVFDVDYSKFTNKAEGTCEQWLICSYGDRIVYSKKSEGNSKKIILTEEFKNLFNEYDIDYKKDIKKQILDLNEKEFFVRFIYLIKAMLQMRNSDKNEDYIISPIKNREGIFFDSRFAEVNEPLDADANGAYNIARKGLWMVNQIRESDAESLNKVKLAMSNKEWLAFAQDI